MHNLISCALEKIESIHMTPLLNTLNDRYNCIRQIEVTVFFILQVKNSTTLNLLITQVMMFSIYLLLNNDFSSALG
jgi:hypothetical protein